MDIALTIVTIVAIAVAFSALSARYALSAPLVLIAVGICVSYLPFLPNVELTPELVLVGLLPPLLYAAAIRTSLIDFRTNKRPIALLSIGLVLFTTAGVGLLVWAMLDVPLSVGLALGAVVAPPDAVAATTIARRIGLPRRIVTILEGESLVNDATAIVTLRTAIAAIAGTVSIWEIGASFLLSAVGGVAVGLAVAFVVGKVRRLITDDITDVAVSLITPWLAYLLAEEIHLPGVEGEPSGVLAVVVAGLILGHKSPLIQSGTSRLFESTNWSTISFVLENAVFLLIGMQISSIVSDVGDSDLSPVLIASTCAAVLVAVIVLRMIWLVPVLYVPRMSQSVRDKDPVSPWRSTLIIGWAGMRGVVTLAAVFLLPVGTPEREVLVLIAFVVTVGTLVLQGLTLPWLVRRLGVPGPDRHEDHLQEAEVYQSVTDAGVAYLDDHEDVHIADSVRRRLRERSFDRSNAVWERLGGRETPTAQYSRTRAAMLDRERAELLRIRDAGLVDQSVLARIMNALDIEETILDRAAEDETTAERETDLRPGVGRTGGCDHLREAVTPPDPITPEGCQECLAAGDEWLHLRLCMQCGHVGCCDSSPGMHAGAHHRETGHPVMRSFEPGEAWRWCFVDELTG